jgi:23S rRNA (uracil1939-C5)-methyltransferase
VIVDPPRFGLGEKTVHEIVALGAEKIISVSCNPSTFARDAAMLCTLGYVLKRVVPVDMFPQTYHIETVAEFAKVS